MSGMETCSRETGQQQPTPSPGRSRQYTGTALVVRRPRSTDRRGRLRVFTTYGTTSRLVRPPRPGTRVVARFGLQGLQGLLGLISRAPLPGRSPATKATEETNLHPGPPQISTLGMTTNGVSCAVGTAASTANPYFGKPQSRSFVGPAANDVRTSYDPRTAHARRRSVRALRARNSTICSEIPRGSTYPRRPRK
jgi:hypothetical protein